MHQSASGLSQAHRGGQPARVAILGVACFLLFVVALHLLRRDVDAMKWGMSFYAIGPYALLMALAFLAISVSFFALAFGLSRGLPTAARSPVGLILLVLAGSAIAAVAFFPSNAVPPVTTGDFTHIAASIIFFFSATIGSVLVSRGFGRHETWRTFRKPALALALASVVALGLIFLLDLPIHGILQRITVGLILLWVLITAMHLRSRAA